MHLIVGFHGMVRNCNVAYLLCFFTALSVTAGNHKTVVVST